LAPDKATLVHQDSECGICGGQYDTGKGISTSPLDFTLSVSFHERSKFKAVNVYTDKYIYGE